MTNLETVTPIRAQDRVSDVLARDESLVEVFVRCAPHFAKLRNRAMRRVMARLVTVEQAARTAQVPVERLLRDLNEAIGLTTDAIAPEPVSRAPAIEGHAGVPAMPPDRQSGDAREAERATAAHPPAAHPPAAPVVELDVRDDLRAGREPFSKIQSTVARLAADEVLHLRAIFEPVPLYTVLGRRGFVHEVRQHAPDDWSVWFWRPGAAAGGAPVPDAHVPGASDARVRSASGAHVSRATDARVPGAGDASAIWLDVRGLQPPEPLMQTLAVLETLPPGHVLVQINSRVPQFLFPLLVERGFAWEVDESEADRVRVRIWRANEGVNGV